MSLTVERGIKLIPSGGDNIIKVGVTSTSKRLSGYVDATSVPYVTSFTFNNQDINRIIGIETLKDLVELDISGNRYLSFNPVEHLLDQKPIKLYNVSDTQCYGFMSFLTTYPAIEFFYANNTLLSGDIQIPPSVKLAEIKGSGNKSTLEGSLVPLYNNPNLVYFDCSNNKIRGSIDIGKLPNAIHLDFSKNKFTRITLDTLTVQTSNIRYFNASDNHVALNDSPGAIPSIVGLEDVYNLLKFFERLKKQYQKGKSPANDFSYVINLSGAYMPALPNPPWEYGYINLLMSELIASLTAEPYSWKVHMGSLPVKEFASSINRARIEAFADPDVRQYVRNWETQNNEVIPTRDFALVDSKVKRLKTITAPVSVGMVETTNPLLTSTNRVLLSTIPISPTLSAYKWYIGSFWDLAGLNFEPDPDHTEYIEEFKTSFLQSKGTSLIYYLELLWFIKTMKYLEYWDSMILWPLKWGQYVNKYIGDSRKMIQIESFGGGQVNPEYNRTGIKRHTLRLWFAKNESLPDENDTSPENVFSTAVLSTLNGIPFSTGIAKYGNTGYKGLRNSMAPDMWLDLGYNAYAGIDLVTTNVEYNTQRKYLAGIPDGFYSILNADINIMLPSSTRKTDWVIQQGRVNNAQVHSVNSYNNFVFTTPTGWPLYAGGIRTDIRGGTNGSDTRYRYQPQISFDQRGAGQMNIFENDLYENPVPDPKVVSPFLEERYNLDGYLWTNWRDLKVTYVSGTPLDFKNNENLVWKFWNNNVQFPNQTSQTTPLTTLTFRYKCWHIPIDSYDSTNSELRFHIGEIPHWFNQTLPSWNSGPRPIVPSGALYSGDTKTETFGGALYDTSFQNKVRAPVLHGRFDHVRGGVNSTRLKITDMSGETYNYKDVALNQVYRDDNTFVWDGLKYKQWRYFWPPAPEPGGQWYTVTTKVPWQDWPSYAGGPYRATIKMSIKDGSSVFPRGSFSLSTNLGFVQGTSGIDLMSGGTGYTNGIYTNVPFKHIHSTFIALTSFPLSSFEGKTSARLIRLTSVQSSPDLNGLEWYYYGNMQVLNKTLSVGNHYPDTSAAALADVQIIDPNYFLTYPNIGGYVTINFRRNVLENRPLFWDTTDTYALWYLTAHNCFVISNTATANIAHSLTSDINCFYNPRLNTSFRSGIGGYGTFLGSNAWTGSVTAVYVPSAVPQQITLRNPDIPNPNVVGSYPSNMFFNSTINFENDVIGFVQPDNNIGGFTGASYARYSLTPGVSPKGTVYVVNNTIVAISATAPGLSCTGDQVFTVDSANVGGTGSGALFRINGVVLNNNKIALRKSITTENPLGSYYYHTPHVVNNTMALQENLGCGFNWDVGGAIEGNWAMWNDTNQIETYQDEYYRFANDYSDENFVTNHFIFNNNKTSLQAITSIYVCGRWWNGSETGARPIRDNRVDERRALDLIKQNNTGVVLGTLTIENTATGAGIVFNVNDVVPEKKYRWVRSRCVHHYLDAVKQDQQLLYRTVPYNTPTLLHLGIGTDKTLYTGINKVPGDPNDNEPSLSYYRYPQSGDNNTRIFFDSYNSNTRVFTFNETQWNVLAGNVRTTYLVFKKPIPSDNLTITVLGRDAATRTLTATTDVFKEDLPQGGGIMLSLDDQDNNALTRKSNRDPQQRNSFVPWRVAEDAGQFDNSLRPSWNQKKDRRTLFDPTQEGLWQYMMLFKSGFEELSANRWLKSNTLHTAITCFFYETSGLDLTPRIK